MQDGSLPCIVFGVIDSAGRTEVSAIAGRKAVVDDSVFFIASVTKAVTATALMQYVDEGRLELRAPLSQYLPEFIGEGREAISAWHLLTHTSGLPDLSHDRIRSERPDYDWMLAHALGTTPQWEPGSRYEYNSSAWVLLSELMSRLSLAPFPEVLYQRLTLPLGMRDTVFDARRLRNRAISVEGVDATNRITSELLLWFLARARLTGGGMFGTVPDLLRLGRALLPPGDAPDPSVRVLSSATVAQMAEPQTAGILGTTEDGATFEIEQGLGWRKSGGAWPPGDTVITHGGQSGTRLWIDPERDLAFAFLTSVWDAPSDAAIAMLHEVYRAAGLAAYGAPPSSMAKSRSCSRQAAWSRSTWRTIQGSTRLLSSMSKLRADRTVASTMPSLLR